MVIYPLYLGTHTGLMSPRAFLKRPLRWLEAINRFQAMFTAAPNFASDLCVQKGLPGEKERLETSGFKIAVNGLDDGHEDGLVIVQESQSLSSAARGDGARREEEIDAAGPRDEAGAPAEREPIAVVGLACRFPGGASSPESFWRVLCDGVNAVTEVPAARWDVDAYYDPDPETPGKTDSRWGGFLEGVERFDPHFFNISPREARGMDPQQRLLLEVAWEALEHAGQAPDKLAGTRAGVFVSVGHSGYMRRAPPAYEEIDPDTLTGTLGSWAAGRLSHFLNLQGPCCVVDTAGASSLVALHLACQSLRAGECRLALAGGVNLMLTPELYVGLSKLRALSPSGACRTFDARADGEVRGEGCGIVVLKRLADAVADGDAIWAIVRGSAINHDGRRHGVTAPNGLAQQAVLRQALQDAEVAPWEVGFVEAHGAGTPLGDPIEVEALREVYGGSRQGRACLLGAVKTNIGHLEAAAGVAGLIKAVLCLRRGEIPPNLHFQALNPAIDLQGAPFLIPTVKAPWPAGYGRRCAAVSSFGISGTNAHVVLEAAPAAAREEAQPAAGPYLLPLSAHSPRALDALARGYRELLEGLGGDAPLADMAHTASVRRSHHAERLALVGGSAQELIAGLDAFAAGQARAGMATGSRRGEAKLVFVFPGQGSQWAGMGRELLEVEPVFRRAIEQCEEALRPYLGWSLLERLRGGQELGGIDVIHPVLFAMAVGLAALWRAWGVEPDAVVGHSIGEVAAAYVAGALRLEDAARVIYEHSRVLNRQRGGAMMAVELPMKQSLEALRGYEDRVSIAACNSPGSTVLSGDKEALDALFTRLKGEGFFCRWLKVDGAAAHSPYMDPLRDELIAALHGLTPAPAQIPFVSTVTGEVVDGASLDARYWMRNLREPVLFSAAVERLLGDGHRIFVEVSPHPVLLPALQWIFLHTSTSGTGVPSLRQDKGGRATLLQAVGALYASGRTIDWERLQPRGRVVALPSYPWQRERCWIEVSGAAARPRGRCGHPLLGEHVESSLRPGEHVWSTEVTLRGLGYVRDYGVQGEVVVPEVAYLEMALTGAEEVYGQGPHRLEGIEFEQELTVGQGGARAVQLAAQEEKGDRATFQIASREGKGPWTRHVRGTLLRGPAPAAADGGLDAIRGRCEKPAAEGELYELLEAVELELGPSFRGIQELWRGGSEALARLRLPEEVAGEAGRYWVHPALLDAGLQVARAALRGDGPEAREGQLYLSVVGAREVRFYGRAGEEAWSHARVTGVREGQAEVDVVLWDAGGGVVLEVLGLRTRAAEGRWDHVSDMGSHERAGWLLEYIRACAARVLGTSPSALDPARPLIAQGLDSLMSLQLMNALKAELDAKVEVNQLLRGASIADVGRVILEQRSAASEPGRGAPAERRLDPVPRTPGQFFPLSYGQEGLWFLQQVGAGAAYNEVFAVRLRGPLDARVLARSFQELVRRHEIFRTEFRVIDGGPTQWIVPFDPEREVLEVIDLRNLPEGEAESEVRRATREKVRTLMEEMRPGQLLRATLFQTERDAILLFLFPHLAGDFWSLLTMIEELAASYRALLCGESPALPELPIQYADYSVWQREALDDAALAYWKRHLEGAPAAIELPTDRPRPAEMSYRGDVHRFVIPAALHAAVIEAAREAGVTPFMVYFAALCALLHRSSGQEDLVIGTPVSTRDRRELEPVIGYFVKVLALRASLAGDPTGLELLQRVRTVVLEGLAHQHVPLEKVLAALQVPRDPARAPLFQIAFAFEGQKLELPRDMGGLELSVFPIEGGTSRFDLTFVLYENPEGMAVAIEYATDLFDAATIRRLGVHFYALLEGLATDGRRRVSELPLLSEQERRVLLEDWSGVEPAYPPDACVHQLFERQVAERPHAVAVEMGGERLTYRELDQRATRIARRLRALGVRPDALVGVCVERSLEMVAALLGILKAGGAYVPLDPSYPAERLRQILEISRLRRIVVGRALRERLPAFDGEALILEEAAAPEVADTLALAPEPSNLAYVLFTSGSTGRPKGVMIEHRSAVAFARWARSAFPPEDLDGVLASTSFSFDLSVFELLVPLCWGGRAVLVENALALPSLPAEAQVKLVNTVPSVMAAFLRGGLPRSVRTVNLAGEPLQGALAEQIYRFGHVRQVFNLYGPTEATTYSTFDAVRRGERPLIGRPIAGTHVYVLDQHRQPVPVGVPGELYIGGEGVARGYLNQPALTAERFLNDPFAGRPGARMYRTGDLVRWLPDSRLEYLGRLDEQVKIRGFRIELGEIEVALRTHPAVREAAVLALPDPGGMRGLVAFLVTDGPLTAAEAQGYLQARLPAFMIPSALRFLDEMPLSAHGKLDRRALARLDARPSRPHELAAPEGRMEQLIAGIWREQLQVEAVGLDESFFELGGHSLLLVSIQRSLSEALLRDIPMVELFRYPTVRSLARHLSGGAAAPAPAPFARVPRRDDDAVAILGMAGRFPGARSVGELWRKLRAGVEGISFFRDEEIEPSPLDPPVGSVALVKAGGVLDGADDFDSAFFGISALEADIMDPQQRLFLECAWEALEDAAWAPKGPARRVGVFAGASTSTYLFSVLQSPLFAKVAGYYPALFASDKDFLATRLAYKLDLRGPAVAVQTACSTSLVAIHMACQSLLERTCDMALAGGASVRMPQRSGYVWLEGGILSPDGHCRPFDAEAQGTVAGSGVGVVILKRLADALADGDRIRAVIRGSAINNDGALKVGYYAPSVEGQAEVIAEALASARVDPATIGYIEAHGTGTALGDPIEIAALDRVFRGAGVARRSRAIGSIKGNIGHLDAAAGVAGVIKTVLALEHQELPPSLHFQRGNPHIDWEESAFFVNASLSPWQRDASPRRAGVSSFGIGGTNAHLVLEEAPPPRAPGPARRWQLIPLSGKTEAALEQATDRLAEHLLSDGEAELTDIAYTLQLGRQPFPHRRVLVAGDRGDATAALSSRAPGRVHTRVAAKEQGTVVALFPGTGAQYPRMGAELYESEPAYREEVDRCARLFEPSLGRDLREMLYVSSDTAEATAPALLSPALSQPAIFTTEYALAKLLGAWGIVPDAMIGHSLGEYTAACLSGVMSLEDAVAMVALRAKLLSRLPPGAMLSVALSEADITPLLGEELSLAAVNAPASCVVSGPPHAVDAIERAMSDRNVKARRLRVPVALHSSMVEPALPELGDALSRMTFAAPRVPYLSNVTGDWITPGEATTSAYWLRHLRGPVRFSAGLTKLLQTPGCLLIEVGPGQALSTLARQHPGCGVTIPAMRHADESGSDLARLLQAIGLLWAAGVDIPWARLHAGAPRRRVGLPTYPFERRRHGLPSAPLAPSAGRELHEGQKREPAADLATLVRSGTLEQAIEELWRQVLGVERVGPGDDFFQLGGDSLAALRLSALLKETLDVTLPMHSLLEGSTLARMVEVVDGARRPARPETREGGAARPPFLILLKPGDHACRSFWIHPAGGTLFSYRAMAERMGAEHEILAFMDPTLLEGNEGALMTQVEDWAATYMAVLRAIQPEGPYALVGHSFGGTVAYELARELIAEGQEVSFLGMLDTPGPGQMPERFANRAEEVAYICYVLGAPLPVSELLLSGPEDQLQRALAHVEERTSARWNKNDFRRLVQAFHASIEAMFAYCPQPTDVRVTFFRAEQRRRMDPINPDEAWRDLARGGLDVYPVPGDHLTMIAPPNLDRLAERLDLCMRQSRAYHPHNARGGSI